MPLLVGMTLRSEQFLILHTTQSLLESFLGYESHQAENNNSFKVKLSEEQTKEQSQSNTTFLRMFRSLNLWCKIAILKNSVLGKKLKNKKHFTDNNIQNSTWSKRNCTCAGITSLGFGGGFCMCLVRRLTIISLQQLENGDTLTF